MPAANATTKLTSAILRFEQLLKEFSRGGTVPFRGTPTTRQPLAFGAYDVSRGQTPGAVQRRDFGFRIQRNRIGQLQLFQKRRRILLAILYVDRKHNKIFVFI